MSRSTETARVRSENLRRSRRIDPRRYSESDPAESFLRRERRKGALRLLQEIGFAGPPTRCLETGVGAGVWVAELVSWGVPEAQIHGIDLDLDRIRRARKGYPAARLTVADAGGLPYRDGGFNLVIASTLFSSVIGADDRRAIAAEMARVLSATGVILLFDFHVGNPANPRVRRLGRREVGALFPDLLVRTRSVGLAPPLLRALAPYSSGAVAALAALPLLRTHFVAVLKRGAPR